MFEDNNDIGKYQSFSCLTMFQDKDADDNEFDDKATVTNYYGEGSFKANPTLLFGEPVGTRNVG